MIFFTWIFAVLHSSNVISSGRGVGGFLPAVSPRKRGIFVPFSGARSPTQNMGNVESV